MEKQEQNLQPGEKLNRIAEIIEGMLTNNDLSYAEYQVEKKRIHQLQQGLDGQEIEKLFSKKINYLAASWRGIVRNNILIEKPMVSQTLPYKETSEQAHEGIRIN